MKLIGLGNREIDEGVAQVSPRGDTQPINNPLNSVFKIWDLNTILSLLISNRWRPRTFNLAAYAGLGHKDSVTLGCQQQILGWIAISFLAIAAISEQAI